MPRAGLETAGGKLTESLRDFRILHDERMTITLVCRTRLYVAGTGQNRQLFASVFPERIVVDSEAGRQEIQVPGTGHGARAGASEAGDGT